MFIKTLKIVRVFLSHLNQAQPEKEKQIFLIGLFPLMCF